MDQCTGDSAWLNELTLFLLLFESIAEQTSELEDEIDVDGQLLAISLSIEIKPYQEHKRLKWYLNGRG